MLILLPLYFVHQKLSDESMSIKMSGYSTNIQIFFFASPREEGLQTKCKDHHWVCWFLQIRENLFSEFFLGFLGIQTIQVVPAETFCILLYSRGISCFFHLISLLSTIYDLGKVVICNQLHWETRNSIVFFLINMKKLNPIGLHVKFLEII